MPSPKPNPECKIGSAYDALNDVSIVSPVSPEDIEYSDLEAKLVNAQIAMTQLIIRHAVLQKCLSCQELLERSVAVPSGCSDSEMGNRLFLYSDKFINAGDLSLTNLLTKIVQENPELTDLMNHIKECFGCALEASDLMKIIYPPKSEEP